MIGEPIGESPTGRQSPLGRLRLCKRFGESFGIILLKQKLLASFNTRFQQFHWQIGTFHVYKKSKQQSRISLISDNLRKQGFDRIFITKELTEDRFNHYHFIVGNARKIKKVVQEVKTVTPIRNHKLWVKPFDLNASINYQPSYEVKIDDEYHQIEKPSYSCFREGVDGLNDSILNLDLGFKHRWIQYGIVRYLLYCMKYLNNTSQLYTDYYIKT